MSEENKPPLPPSASPSASQSSTPDAPDSASVRRLAEALEGLRRDIAKVDDRVATALRTGEFRERIVTTAIERGAAADKALAEQVRLSLRLNREVVTEERKAVEHAVMRLDESGKHLLLPRESDEQVVTRVVVTRVVPWVARRSLALKLFAAIATGVGAVYAALKAFAHRF